MAQIAARHYSAAEYLALEAQATQKHEYYQGRIYAMAGASPNHNTIAHNLHGLLYNALRGQTCRTFGSDQRVHVPATGFYTYPDLAVACAPQFVTVQGLDSLTNPVVVIEILSETTSEYDRIDKVALYKELPSLDTYVLVAQHRPYTECFARNRRFWMVEPSVGTDATLTLPALSVTLPLAAIYEGVQWPTPTDQHPMPERG